jgi:hypothetical protein
MNICLENFLTEVSRSVLGIFLIEGIEPEEENIIEYMQVKKAASVNSQPS